MNDNHDDDDDASNDTVENVNTDTPAKSKIENLVDPRLSPAFSY